ncbi:nitroreductase family protein (plasmid) [Rhizobium sp. CB3171]|uniref:nitroreductase family protein n=1 Tax=Rhizobium sp. CB3171 TaxID=3039157 RepID=UPI0024B24C2F|nr:nitroreductase family protein [Rhizobium sp. CB3171]WFU05195.1 nitroreductase family protein [Rhizobium sp. CB3171]
MSNSFIDAIRRRRSQYALGKTLPVSADTVTNLVKEAVRLSPSTFNSQSSRVVILFGEQSDQLWALTKEALRKIVPADSFGSTEAKIDRFSAGAGTVLFFEDQDTVTLLQEKYPLYADNFPTFSEHSSGITQFAVWSALADAGIGASLQHYNPLIDEQVSAAWQLPISWRLRAQLPFGSNEAQPADKPFIDDALRFRVFG